MHPEGVRVGEHTKKRALRPEKTRQTGLKARGKQEKHQPNRGKRRDTKREFYLLSFSDYQTKKELVFYGAARLKAH